MKILYNDFKIECFDKLSPKERNKLFYWSLMDTSSWEEYPPDYYPDDKEGFKSVVATLRKSKKIYKIIKKDKKFIREFVDQEFLTNYILAAAIENKSKGQWKPDISNLEKAVFPDVKLQNKPRNPVEIEVKGMLSTLNLKERIENEILPILKNDGHKYFLLLLLFPLCPTDKPERISHLIGGYYIYEKIMQQSGTKRQVFCQCISLDNTNNEYILDKLVTRIEEHYFEKLELLD